jgi:hypothetical protein
VRFTLLLASSALAASLVLSACSGGSQTIPGGSTVAPMGHHAAQLVAPGAQRDASCPATYFVCVTLYPGTTTQGICISTSGNCTTGLVGSWNWSETITTVKTGKKYKKIKPSFSPNPGNPTTNSFKAKKVKNSHGKVKWAAALKACEVTNPASCIYGTIGLIGG